MEEQNRQSGSKGGSYEKIPRKYSLTVTLRFLVHMMGFPKKLL